MSHLLKNILEMFISRNPVNDNKNSQFLALSDYIDGKLQIEDVMIFLDELVEGEKYCMIDAWVSTNFELFRRVNSDSLICILSCMAKVSHKLSSYEELKSLTRTELIGVFGSQKTDVVLQHF
jgi:hypothetical protein